MGRIAPLLFLPLLCTCKAHPDAYPSCVELVAAAPADWSRLLPPLHAQGSHVVPAMLRALQENPDGAGRQAAVQLLGSWPDNQGTLFLQAEIEEGRDQAAEAALALGRMPSTASMALLRNTISDPQKPILVRTCAAAALIDLGDPQSAWPLARAVLLAATPQGRSDTVTLALPEKTRWAHERHILLEAMRRLSGGELFGLDEDAPWPRLAEGVDRYGKFLRSKKR